MNTARVAGDIAGDDQRALKARVSRHQSINALLRGLPLHRGAQRAPLHHHHFAGIYPAHLTGTAVALAQVAAEQPRRPNFTIAGHQVADVLAGAAQQGHGLQQASEVTTVFSQLRHESVALGNTQQLRGDAYMLVLDSREFLGNRGVAGFSQTHQTQEGVRNTLAGGKHHAKARLRVRFENVGDAPETGGVSNAAAAELVNAPLACWPRQRKHGLGRWSGHGIRLLKTPIEPRILPIAAQKIHALQGLTHVSPSAKNR